MGVLYICDQGYAIQGLNTDRITAVCQENKQLSRVPSCQREFYIYFLKKTLKPFPFRLIFYFI